MFSRSVPSTPQGCIPFRECRAKTCPDGSPGTSVFDHCRYAGYVAEGLLALLPASVRGMLYGRREVRPPARAQDQARKASSKHEEAVLPPCPCIRTSRVH